MTFSFDVGLTDDRDKVRLHIGDTDSEGYYLHDETIDALLTSEGSIGGAVIACLRFIITQLSTPNYKLDWLSVSNDKAVESFERILTRKAQEFGINATGLTASATISLPYRADSDQDSDDAVYDGSAA